MATPFFIFIFLIFCHNNFKVQFFFCFCFFNLLTMESYPEKSIAAAGKWLECVPKGSCVEVNSHNSNTEVLTKKLFFLRQDLM